MVLPSRPLARKLRRAKPNRSPEAFPASRPPAAGRTTSGPKKAAQAAFFSVVVRLRRPGGERLLPLGLLKLFKAAPFQRPADRLEFVDLCAACLQGDAFPRPAVRPLPKHSLPVRPEKRVVFGR